MGLCEISHGEIYHREFDLARNPPPPTCTRSLGRCVPYVKPAGFAHTGSLGRSVRHVQHAEVAETGLAAALLGTFRLLGSLIPVYVIPPPHIIPFFIIPFLFAYFPVFPVIRISMVLVAMLRLCHGRGFRLGILRRQVIRRRRVILFILRRCCDIRGLLLCACQFWKMVLSFFGKQARVQQNRRDRRGCGRVVGIARHCEATDHIMSPR